MLRRDFDSSKRLLLKQNIKPMHQYWGKAESHQGKLSYLSVWEHSLNVTAVAKVWLTKRPILLTRWTQLLGWDASNEIQRTQALQVALHGILLHDLGKYDWRFQAKVPELFQALTGVELKKRTGSFDHGAWGLKYYAILKSGGKKPRYHRLPWYHLIRAATSHHGKYSAIEGSGQSLVPAEKIKDSETLSKIHEAICQHIAQAEQLFPWPEEAPSEITPAMVIFLSGLCTVSDWLGSNQDHFPTHPLDPSQQPLKTITEGLENKAKTVLQESDLLGHYVGKSENRILKILGNHYEPYPLQQFVLQMPLSHLPQLMIIEAPMGEGKTEAAMFAVDRLLEQRIVDNFYIGLPTMATSNAMFKRLVKMLKNQTFFDEHSSLVLGTGKRQYNDLFRKCIIPYPSEGDEESENPSALKMCNAFFSDSHKRTLLANAGVGTVDQAMSAVLGGKHHWVKLFGLSSSVLVLDEIHSYDQYMVRILQRLLHYMQVFGSHVILLSATLPTSTKQQLIQAFAGETHKAIKPTKNTSNGGESPYPLITHVFRENQIFRMQAKACPHMETLEKKIRFKWTSDSEQVLESLLTFANQGAQICLIVNTVKKAQAFYECLVQDSRSQTIEALLFHSRFQLKDRNALEEKVLNTFGKDGKDQRCEKGRILVATQVVEQSLDVDFDVMVSELAPIDLLLQRAGRLHRHPKENNPFRENRLWENPCLFVFSSCETISEWLADRKDNENARSVYDAYILYRTALLFHRDNFNFLVKLPTDIRSLVEYVYTEEQVDVLEEDQTVYQQKLQEWKDVNTVQRSYGAEFVQPLPDGDPFELGEKRDPEKYEATDALGLLDEDLELGGTRLAGASVSVYFVDWKWTLQITGREHGNASYLEFKQKMELHSLTVIEALLRKKDGKRIQSGEFDQTEAWSHLGEWKETLKRFEKEFRYDNPLILPLPPNPEEITEYRFCGGALALLYSSRLGLQINC